MAPLYKSRNLRQQKAMKLFLSALALALVFEGILFALFPSFMREQMREISGLPAASLRVCGIAALAAATILAACARYFF